MKKTDKSRFHGIIENVIPMRGDSLRKILRKLLMLTLIAVFAVGLWILVSYYVGSYFNKQENGSLAKLHSSSAVTIPKTVPAKPPASGMLPDFIALYKQNKEVKGWISIPKAGIDLPVVQAPDNKKYLKTDFKNNKSRDGSIFLDYRDSIKPMSQDLILYGHNMQDGQMFAGLESYAKSGKNDYLKFYNSSPLITFDTLYERSQWKIFAVFATTADSKYAGSLYYLDTDFNNATDFYTFINAVKARSFVSTKVDVNSSDKLLTLSTCNYDYPSTENEWARLVVVARKVRPGESTYVAPATANAHVTFPQVWIQKWKGNSSK